MVEGSASQGPLRAGSPLRTPRAAAVAGIVFAVLLIAALVLLRLSVPANPRVAGTWLTDAGRRAIVSRHAAALYDQQFDLRHTISALRFPS